MFRTLLTCPQLLNEHSGCSHAQTDHINFHYRHCRLRYTGEYAVVKGSHLHIVRDTNPTLGEFAHKMEGNGAVRGHISSAQTIPMGFHIGGNIRRCQQSFRRTARRLGKPCRLQAALVTGIPFRRKHLFKAVCQETDLRRAGFQKPCRRAPPRLNVVNNQKNGCSPGRL